jgi:hypothetical protein
MSKPKFQASNKINDIFNQINILNKQILKSKNSAFHKISLKYKTSKNTPRKGPQKSINKNSNNKIAKNIDLNIEVNKNLLKTKLLTKELNNIISNINNRNNIFNNRFNCSLFPRNNNFNIRIQKRKKIGLNQKNRGGHSSSVEGNKNSTLAIAGNIIMNNNKLNLISGNNRSISKENGNIYRNKPNNSLPEINLTQIDVINKNSHDNQNCSISSRNKTLNEILEEYEEINYNDFEKINYSSKFLIDLNKYNNNFVIFLKIFQIHLDIEILLNCLNINVNNNQNNKNKNEMNCPLRQKIQLYINNDKQYKLLSSLNTYFNLLNEIYSTNIKNISQNNEQNDLCFFTFSILNKIFKNCIKSQICLFSSILISISHLTIFDFNIILKNFFYKIFN